MTVRGRPKQDTPRVNKVLIRFTDEELEEIKKISDGTKKPVSATVRMLIEYAIEDVKSNEVKNIESGTLARFIEYANRIKEIKRSESNKSETQENPLEIRFDDEVFSGLELISERSNRTKEEIVNEIVKGFIRTENNIKKG